MAEKRKKHGALDGAALRLVANRPDPDDNEPFHPVDADGHVVCFSTEGILGKNDTNTVFLAEVILPNGVAPREAASVLRKLADRVERHGAGLLNLPVGAMGEFDADGNPEGSILSIQWSDYDEDGRLKVPPIE
jgi:hypothetical protein